MKATYLLLALATSFVQSVKISREPLRSWSPTPKADAFKMNYAVPHFGEDADIQATKVSTAIAEKQYNHYVWPADDFAPPKRDYFVPHFGVDSEIGDSLNNLATWEKTFNHKMGQ